MRLTRRLPKGSYVWVAVILAIALLTVGGVYSFPDEYWLGAIPIFLMIWSIAMVVRSRLFTRCPTCGSRMRPRDGTDPASGKQTLYFDCQRCDTEWNSDEIHTEASGD